MNEQKQGRGRPSLKSSERIELFLNAVKIGATRTAAAGSAGMTWPAIRDGWLSGDEEFEQQLAEAEGQAECAFTQVLYDAAHGTNGIPRDWRAAESWLKRRRREDYGDSLDLTKIPTDRLRELLREAQEAREAQYPPEDKLQAMIDGGYVNGADDI